jgi:hypothetical protein
MAQPLYPFGEMGQDAGEPEQYREKCEPDRHPKDGGGIGDKKEETGSYQCEQRPEIHGSIEKRQQRDLCALMFSDEDAPP